MFERLVSGMLAACCTAALLACVPGAGGNVSGPDLALPSAAVLPTRVPNSRVVEGRWDIVSFRGYEPQRLRGTSRAAYADFRADGVGLKIECNSSGVAGDVQNGQFRARPGDRIQTVMGCGPEREARDAALFGFFDRTPLVELLGDSRLRLTSGEDVLLLERPATRRLAFLPSPEQLLGEWRLLEITRYHEGGGYSGIGLSELPGRVEFDGIEARYTPCPQYRLSYRYAPEGRIEKIGGAPVPTARQGCEALKAELFGRDMPQPWDALRVLHADPLVELVDAETILVSTERYGVLLTKRPSDF